MKVTFLTSSHNYDDDRICYNMANSLLKKKYQVEIISSLSNYNNHQKIHFNCFDGSQISKKEKIKKYIELLNNTKPDIVICSEPITVVAASKYKKLENTKIVFDITEWYPSKKNLRNHTFILRPFFFILYTLFFILALFKTDSFIFGEHYKSIVPKFLFPRKQFEYISYFPNRKHIPQTVPKLKKNHLRLSYSGRFSIEKGFLNFINVVKILSENSKLNIEVKLIGYFSHKDKTVCLKAIQDLKDNVSIQIYPMQTLGTFYELIADTDVFLDLRVNDFENTHCLPIKIFNYMALGKPVIYSDLKAIKKVLNINAFGLLTNPKKHQEIANYILKYLNDENRYKQHCEKAKIETDTKFNWEIEAKKFFTYIGKLSTTNND